MNNELDHIERMRMNARVEIVDDERAEGNGIIITLRQGWSFDPLQDNRVAGEDTIAAAVRLIRHAYPFAGPYTD